jgi:alpha-beta hydrolase superfamily lysophospholipase
MSVTRRLVRWLVYAVVACSVLFGVVLWLFAFQARLRLPDLRAWHRIRLENEFHASSAGAPRTFEEYRRLEDRLFDEVRRRVLDDPSAADTQTLGRYTPGSVPARLALETPYDRSFELAPEHPRGAVLLVHGLSDSPYSMRALAEVFFAQGYHVVALRLPGHGTMPSGLLDVTWKDWYAAVVLAAKHAASKAGPGHPFLAGGHSTGAALVTLYSVRALDDPSLPKPERLYLVSPAIGITEFAVLTNIADALSIVPRFEKAKWIDVLPEYDPYKFNSFPVNAANQIYRLTHVLRDSIVDAGRRGRLEAMPRVTVFQSIVDSTVTARQVVQGLLARLPARGHELVVFDVNRRDALQGLIGPGPMEDLRRMREASGAPFRLTLIGNRDPGTAAIASFTRAAGAGADAIQIEDLALEWPRGVFSLGHVALPFPEDDPVYGLTPAAWNWPAYPLGAVAARGEEGALTVPLGTFARMRCNPFFDVIRRKVIDSLGDTPTPAP